MREPASAAGERVSCNVFSGAEAKLNVDATSSEGAAFAFSAAREAGAATDVRSNFGCGRSDAAIGAVPIEDVIETARGANRAFIGSSKAALTMPLRTHSLACLGRAPDAGLQTCATQTSGAITPIVIPITNKSRGGIGTHPQRRRLQT